MPCLLVLASFCAPRVALFFIFLLTDWIKQAYDSALWPLLGFFFMPYTTLAYMAAMLNNDHNVSGGWLVLVVVAVFLDLGGQSKTTSVSIKTRSAKGAKAD
jgi:hypothetical protein